MGRRGPDGRRRLIVNDFIPAIWGGLKLILAAAALCFFLPAVALGVLVCNLVRQEFGHEPGTVAEAILRGSKRYGEMFQVLRLPARSRYVIVSDIHRWSDKDEQEAGFLNDSRLLFDRVLDHYGAFEPAAGRTWSLIENGDVEDFWLSGGSWWGVVYDMASMLPSPALDIKFLDDGLLTAALAHQKRIFATPHKDVRAHPRVLHPQPLLPDHWQSRRHQFSTGNAETHR